MSEIGLWVAESEPQAAGVLRHAQFQQFKVIAGRAKRN